MISGVEEVTACSIHSFSSILVLHCDFIPDDEPHSLDEIGKVPLFHNGAVTVVIGLEGDFEH